MNDSPERVLLREALDVLDSAQSGYIPGCGEDEKWGKRKDQLVTDLRALLSRSEGETAKFVDIVFDGPPSHKSGRFVEVEDETGKSINFGEWVERPTGYWALRIAVIG